MGHTRLPSLPQTRKWREVISLIGDDAGSAAAIAGATLDAAENTFIASAADQGLVRAVWLLAQLPDAAKSADFGNALQKLGIDATDTPSVAEIASGVASALDRHLDRSAKRTDLAEMAVGAAVEALAHTLTQRTAGLFPHPGDVRRELSKLATAGQFGSLARDFFARLAKRSLRYYVDRELPNHVGGARRFKTLADRQAFSEALDLHCRQAAKIVEGFAGGWWSKARFERDLSEQRTAGFVRYALKKLRDELRRGGTA